MLAILLLAAALDDLDRAQALAWEQRFVEAEAVYRALPPSPEAQLGLARVVLWQKRYDEAIALFDAIRPATVDSLEGRATALYWSGDFRGAARLFRRVLDIDPQREFSARSLAEIRAAFASSQRIAVDTLDDDQPLDRLRAEATATFYSDPLTRWSATAGWYRLETVRVRPRSGEVARIANETRFPRAHLVASGDIGALEFPDGTTRAVGGAAVRYRALTLRVDHREDLASATSLLTHVTATTASLRWDYQGLAIAAAEASRRRWFDDNTSLAAFAYAVAPILRRGPWTVWSGASAMARDTDETRFGVNAVSSELDPSIGLFRYRYRGHYAPYWTPDDLREARLIVAVERQLRRGGVKLHADAGFARDRGRAFGPETGLTPLPADVFSFAFDRDYRPYRLALSGDVRVAGPYRLEIGAERSVTTDYRANSFHAAVVRRH